MEDGKTNRPYHGGKGTARKINQVHLHEPGPVPPHQAGKGRVNINRMDDGNAPRLEYPMNLNQQGKRIMEMLDHVPRGDNIEVIVRELCLFQRAVKDR